MNNIINTSLKVQLLFFKVHDHRMSPIYAASRSLRIRTHRVAEKDAADGVRNMKCITSSEQARIA